MHWLWALHLLLPGFQSVKRLIYAPFIHSGENSQRIYLDIVFASLLTLYSFIDKYRDLYGILMFVLIGVSLLLITRKETKGGVLKYFLNGVLFSILVGNRLAGTSLILVVAVAILMEELIFNDALGNIFPPFITALLLSGLETYSPQFTNIILPATGVVFLLLSRRLKIYFTLSVLVFIIFNTEIIVGIVFSTIIALSYPGLISNGKIRETIQGIATGFFILNWGLYAIFPSIILKGILSCF